MSDLFGVLRRRTLRDVAITAIKVVANAITTMRRMGEASAPCFLGCGAGSDSRAHYLICDTLRAIAVGSFPRQADRWPASGSLENALFMGMAGTPEAVVYLAIWHDAWVQVAAAGRRVWREVREPPGRA